MNNPGRLINFIGKANWYILLLLGLGVLPLADITVLSGVAAGGLIAIVNFHLLQRTIENHLHPLGAEQGQRSVLGRMLARYYIRFFISAALIFILISSHWVHPLGLLAGVSVVVVSIFTGTIVLVAESLFKEAV